MNKKNTTTQPAHLIKMECDGCGGFGRRNSKDPMQNDRACLYCIKGQIEYLIGTIKFQPSDPCFVIQPNDPDYKDCENGLVYDDDNFKWYTWPEVATFKCGDTVPTSAGPRIAGEVSLFNVNEHFKTLRNDEWFNKVVAMENDLRCKQLPDYLCIAKSHPVKITEYLNE